MKKILLLLLMSFTLWLPAEAAFHHHPHVTHHRSASSKRNAAMRNAHLSRVAANNKGTNYKSHHYNYTSDRPSDWWAHNNRMRLIIWLALYNHNHPSGSPEDVTCEYRVTFTDGDVVDYNLTMDKNTYSRYFASGKAGPVVRGINVLLRDSDCVAIDPDDVAKVQRIIKRN